MAGPKVNIFIGPVVVTVMCFAVAHTLYANLCTVVTDITSHCWCVRSKFSDGVVVVVKDNVKV